MTRAEREIMIQRYMGGGMNSAEEQEFFIQVAVDPELRLELKAHRTVESALRKDRDAEPAGHTVLRGKIAGTLAAHPPQPDPIGASGSAYGTGTAGAAGVQATMGLTAKWIAAAFLAIGTTAAVVLSFPATEQKNPFNSTSSAPAVSAPAYRFDSLPPAPAPAATDLPIPTVPDDLHSTQTSEPATGRESESARYRRDRVGERSPGRPARSPERSSDRAAPAERPRASLPDLDGAKPRRKHADSIGIGVTIEVNK